MSWQIGSTVLGLSLAIGSWVAHMMGFTLPRWLVALLLGNWHSSNVRMACYLSGGHIGH